MKKKNKVEIIQEGFEEDLDFFTEDSRIALFKKLHSKGVSRPSLELIAAFIESNCKGFFERHRIDLKKVKDKGLDWNLDLHFFGEYNITNDGLEDCFNSQIKHHTAWNLKERLVAYLVSQKILSSNDMPELFFLGFTLGKIIGRSNSYETRRKHENYLQAKSGSKNKGRWSLANATEEIIKFLETSGKTITLHSILRVYKGLCDKKEEVKNLNTQIKNRYTNSDSFLFCIYDANKQTITLEYDNQIRSTSFDSIRKQSEKIRKNRI